MKNMLIFKSYFSSSSGNLHTCSDGETKIIIDFGIPLHKARKALGFSISEYSAAIISHSHKDHCVGVPAAIRMGLDCYLLEHTIQDLSISGHRVHKIEPMKLFKIGSLKILPFPGQHDVPIVGFLIESAHGGKMVYLTDSYYCKFKFKNVNIFALEANYSKEILEKNIKAGVVPQEIRNRIVKSHFEIENLKEFFRSNDLSQVKAIYLIHLSGDNSDADRFKTQIQETTGKPVYI